MLNSERIRIILEDIIYYIIIYVYIHNILVSVGRIINHHNIYIIQRSVQNIVESIIILVDDT